MQLYRYLKRICPIIEIYVTFGQVPVDQAIDHFYYQGGEYGSARN